MCQKCRFFGARTKTCDYLLICRQQRGCPVEDCLRYEARGVIKPRLDSYFFRRFI